MIRYEIRAWDKHNREYPPLSIPGTWTHAWKKFAKFRAACYDCVALEVRLDSVDELGGTWSDLVWSGSSQDFLTEFDGVDMVCPYDGRYNTTVVIG